MSKQRWKNDEEKISVALRSATAMTAAIAIALIITSTPSPALAQFTVPDASAVPQLTDEQLHPGAEEKISKSLQAPQHGAGDASATAKTTSGDPILDDVLDVIRKQGSVLRGSELDPESDLPSIPLNDGFQSQERSRPSPSSESNRTHSSYLVAEQLLRSARALESLDGMTDRRSELIHGMRSQAAKLLIDAISKDAQPIQP